MANTKVDVEMWNAKGDFNLWSKKMKALLMQQKCAKALDESWGEEVTQIRRTEQMETAWSTIFLHLSDNVIREVGDTTTAIDIWTKLESLYKTKTLPNKCYLWKQFFSFKFESNSDLETNLDRFNKLSQDLTNSGETLSSDQKSVALLSSLPDKYKELKNALEYGRISVTVDDIVASLRNKELEFKSETKTSTTGVGYHIRGNYSYKKNNNSFQNKTFGKPKDYSGNFSKDKNKFNKFDSKAKGKRCYFCGKMGHFIKDCIKRMDELKNSNKIEGGAALAYEEAAASNGQVYVTCHSSGKDEWILDSGCTFHMTPCKKYFTEFMEVNGGQVIMGNDFSCKIKGIGKIVLKLENGYVLTLNKIRYIPSLKRNLISLGTLDDEGFNTIINKGTLILQKKFDKIAQVFKSNGIYILKALQQKNQSIAAAVTLSDKSEIWHKRLGHLSDKNLHILKKQGHLGNEKIEKVSFCEHCIYGKQKKLPFSAGTHKSTCILDYLHADLWGPASVNTYSGFKYYLLIIDDLSRKSWVLLLKNKSDTFQNFVNWKTLVENQVNKKVKTLRTDNGLEFCNEEFDNFCKDNGILRHRTVVYTPQQNGLAERMNRTLLERVRCMLTSSGLPKLFWGEAVKTASYLINKCPTKSLNYETPDQVWNGQPADYSKLKTFGCSAYVHQNEGKLEPRSIKGVFLGYGEGVKGYRVWLKGLGGYRVTISRNVVFNEIDMPCLKEKGSTPTETDQNISTIQTELTPAELNTENENQFQVEHAPEQDTPDLNSETEPDPHINPLEDYLLARDRTRREIRPPARYSEPDFITALSVIGPLEGDPTSYEEAVEGKNANMWLEAMKDEMLSLEKNNTWVLVNKPKGAKVIDCKWIYKVKEGDPKDDSVRFKARLVAKGFNQREGIDYNEIFSPVVKYTSIRILLSIVSQYDFELEQLDVKTAFLHGNLDEKIFMSQPKGFEQKGKENWVCYLKKSLYGLKQAPRQWYIRFDTFIKSLDFNRSEYDPCFYYKGKGGPNSYYLLLYVDDMLLAGYDANEIKNIKQRLKQEFEMKDLGCAKRILGMEIKRNRSNQTLFLTQQTYILKMLTRFSMNEAKVVTLPLASHFKFSVEQCPKSEFERSRMDKIPYANAIGSVMYVMVCTRPDLAFAISTLSRYMSNPGEYHWEALKWLLKYLKGTSDLGLMFCKGETEIQLKGFVDSDFAGNCDNRKSTSAYVFTVNNACVSWKSQLQKIVALSTTEAEYIAASDAVKEGIWLKNLLDEIGFSGNDATVYSDSQSAIHLSRNPVFHDRTKHIDVKFHFIRDIIEKEIIKIEKISTKCNPADMGTKILPLYKFKDCLNLLNIITD